MTPTNFNGVKQRPDFGGEALKNQVVIQPVILQFTAKQGISISLTLF